MKQLPPGPFKLLYADPPWRFEVRDRRTGLGRSADRHYDTVPLPELMGIPVRRVIGRDAVLAMWVYDPLLPAALQLAEAWGFERYITVLFRWIKTTDGQYKLFECGERLGYGTGYHTRAGGCEECWLFRRGRGLKVRRHDIKREFFAPVREHSRKPDEVSGWLVDLYGDVPRLELFARTQRAGWDSWGNERQKFA